MRGVLRALVVTVAILAVAVEAAAANPVSVTFVSQDSREHCVIQETPSSVEDAPCVLAWETRETLGAGDDEFRVGGSVDTLIVVVEHPAGHIERSFDVDPASWSFEHPVYSRLNETWIAANESRPAVLRDDVYFDSRPGRTYYEEGMRYDADYGLFLMVRSPTGSGNEGDWFRTVSFCWDICQYDGPNVPRQNETSMRPLPDGAMAPQGWNGSDGEVETLLILSQVCPQPDLVGWETCHKKDVVNGPASDVYAFWVASTPSVGWAARVNRTQVDVRPGHDEQGAVSSFDVDASFTDIRASTGPFPAHDPRLSPATEPAGGVPAEEPSLPPVVLTPAPQDGEFVAVGQTAASERPSVALVVGAASAAGVLLILALWPLFHRILKHRAVEHPLRARILETVRSEPGLKTAALAARLDVSHNTAKHHIDTLERLGILARAGPGQPRWVLAGSLSRDGQRATRSRTRRRGASTRRSRRARSWPMRTSRQHSGFRRRVYRKP